jgi:NADPH:quinone reductase-like Zn-dependent oxidoreductase
MVGLAVSIASAIVSCSNSTTNSDGKMQAIQYRQFGAATELKLVEVARPVPQSREVLVRVVAASVNPVDWKVRNGEAAALVKQFPVTPGYDLAGEIVAVGDGVQVRKVGDRVFAMRPLREPGTYAEYATVAENLVALKPTKATMEDAAALPLAALTAYQALFKTGELKSGQTVLIHGAAGGVGSFAVQMAKSRGAIAIGTGSARSVGYIQSLGADRVIDYRATRFETVVKDVDLVIDTVGGDTLARSYGVIKKGGRIVSLIGKPDAQKAQQLGIKSGERLVVYPSGEELAEIAQMVDAGEIKITKQVFPLKDVIKATEQSETGKTRGKIVLQVGTSQ